MTPPAACKSAFDTAGAAVFPQIVSPEVCAHLRHEIGNLTAGERIHNPSPAVAALIGMRGALGKLAAALGGPAARAVRLLAFDKSPERNWALGWHQDRVISVRERRDVDGFHNWTEKHGLPHVEPPEDILKRMFSLRLHLDDCPASNGALKIVPESWQRGRVEKTRLIDEARRSTPVICEAACGDVVAMRALTYHASDAAETPTHRRVLHVDYACCDLPGGLSWALTGVPEEASCSSH